MIVAIVLIWRHCKCLPLSPTDMMRITAKQTPLSLRWNYTDPHIDEALILWADYINTNSIAGSDLWLVVQEKLS